MLRFEPEMHKFEPVTETELKSENILERYDLQESIAISWELFRNEIGLPSSYLIGKEINPHPSTQDSIDLLAFNPDDSSLIVIELKRGKNKLQLLQAITYAAMVNTWDKEMLISNIQSEYNPEPDELKDLIGGSDDTGEVKIVMVAEYYDPEVIIAADWLSSNYSLDITAYAISLHKIQENTFLIIEQRYPLRELSDAYESRVRRKKPTGPKSEISWDDVIPKLRYPFGRRGIELCRKIKEGEPSRRRFGMIRSSYDGFNWISINFREKYINVYIRGDFEEAEEFLQSKFEDDVKINSWRDGWSILIETPNQFEDLVKWLKLE